MMKEIKTSRKLELDEYLCMSKEVMCWVYKEGIYHIIFQNWLCDYRIEQIMKLIKECILEN